MWSPSFNHSSCVGEVEEGESGELRDEGVFHWEENGRPGDSGRDDSVCVARVAVYAPIFGPF